MIFILSHDPFGQNRMCYTVKNVVLEEPDIKYEDGAVSIFLYTKGEVGGSEKLAQLLKYIMESSEANAVSGEIKEIHDYVTRIKHRKEVGVRYMKSWEFERMWRAEGKVEALLDILEERGKVPKALEDRLRSETDSMLLGRWLKLAVKVNSIAEFENGIFPKKEEEED